MKFLIEKEKYEELLTEMLDGDLKHSRRAEILQELRANYTNIRESVAEIQSNVERLQQDNDDLIVSNSKLFRQLGVVGGEEKETVEKKEFSEEINLEMIEGGKI